MTLLAECGVIGSQLLDVRYACFGFFQLVDFYDWTVFWIG